MWPGLMHGLAAGLSGLGDEVQKRWESMVARERRYDAQVNDVRTTLSVMQRAVQTLKRELETGAIGAMGATGATGATGAVGATGAMGATGAQCRSIRISTSASKISFGDPSTTSGARRGVRAAVRRRERRA